MQLEHQLVLPPAAEDQMRVRVDQTGRDQLPAGVDRLRAGSRRRCAGPDLRNHIVFNEYPCVFQNADLALCPAAPRGGSLRRGQHTDVGDQRSFHCLFLSRSALQLRHGLLDDGAVRHIGHCDVVLPGVKLVIFRRRRHGVLVAGPAAAGDADVCDGLWQ